MMIVFIFLYHKDLIYQHVIFQNLIVSVEYYASVFKILREDISRKRHKYVGYWTLHHNNARSHVTISIQKYLSKSNFNTASHTPLSPDLALCNLCCFRR